MPADPPCDAELRLAGPAAVLPPDLAGERLIDGRQLDALLGISRPTRERWLASGRLPPPFRLSATRHRWRLREILRWIEQGCPAPGRPARRATT
jgi:predicted DNA-binding transcriptional regulator AlpA